MKKQLMKMMCFVAAVFLFAACGPTEKPAFQNAAPEVKQVWDKAVAADKANDYFVANTNYVALLRQPISPEQIVAVQAAVGALNERMQNEAAKGNAAAQKAVEDLKNLAAAHGSGRPTGR